MKYQFEIEDIIAGNWIICQSAPVGFKDTKFAATVVFKIGFIAGTNEWCLVNALTDGCTYTYKSKENLLTGNHDKF